MTKRILLAAFALLATAQAVSADSYEYNSENARVVVECHGYLDKLSVYVLSSWPAEDASQAVTSVELGVVVKTFAPKQQFEYLDDSKDQGQYATLEANVGTGLGRATYGVPSWTGMNQSSKSKSFTTGLTLKTSVYSGKASLNCNMSLKAVKLSQQVNY